MGMPSMQASKWSDIDELAATKFSNLQQRVNIARGFAYAHPVMLLNAPTASLYATICEIVLKLIEKAKTRGTAVICIFHDKAARAQVCAREIEVSRFTLGVAA